MKRLDAAQIIDIIDQRIRRLTRSLAMVETTWGVVAAQDVGTNTVDVYLYGSTTASEGFRVLGGALPSVSAVVKVAIDKATGDRWVMEPIIATSEPGVSDHGSLTGLADDDHTQYATNTELDAHTGDTVDAHDASAVSVDPTGLDNITDTDVQGALGELDAAITALGGAGITFAINYIIDGGSATLTTGIRPVIRIPVACTVTAARAYADQNGSVQIDVLRTTHSAYDMPSTHPVAGDSIIGAGTDITISSADKVEYTSLNWDDVTLDAGDLIAFNVVSATTIRKVTIALTLTT